MIKKTVTYTDYNGVSQTEDHYFNLTKVELMKLRVKMDGKYLDYLESLVENGKVEGLFDFFYNLLLDAHGIKSEDGKKFIKNPATREDFEQSIAFSEILYEYLNNADSLSNFTRAILPPDFQNLETPEGVVMLDAVPVQPPIG